MQRMPRFTSVSNTSAILLGELAAWPTKRELTSILQAAGLRVLVGTYSLRLTDLQSDFAFRECGGDVAEPVITADADSVEELMHDARLVSDALALAKIRHRFEIYQEGGELTGYLHLKWPRS